MKEERWGVPALRRLHLSTLFMQYYIMKGGNCYGRATTYHELTRASVGINNDRSSEGITMRDQQSLDRRHKEKEELHLLKQNEKGRSPVVYECNTEC